MACCAMTGAGARAQLWEHLVRYSIVPDTSAVLPYLRAFEERHPEMTQRITNVKEVINLLTEHKLNTGEKDEVRLNLRWHSRLGGVISQTFAVSRTRT